MGFAEALTLVFIVLKLTGFISWSWWLVLLPEIIAIGFYFLFIFGSAIMTGFMLSWHKKSARKNWRK